MPEFDPFPTLLLSIARNPVTAVGLPLAAGFLSGLPTKKVIEGVWYKSLECPPGRPPKKAFPIVWSLLYVGMGYVSHLAVDAYESGVAPSTRESAALGLKLYYVQLGLNLLWTPLFFVAKRPGLALIDITALTGTTVYLTKILHGPTEGVSTCILAPYCAWLGVATYLNAGIWWKNRKRQIPKMD